MALSYMFSKFIICLVKNYLQLCFNKIEIKSLHSLLNQCAASAKLPLPEIRYIFSQWQLLQMVFRSMIPNITHHLSMYVVYSKTLLICKKKHESIINLNYIFFSFILGWNNWRCIYGCVRITREKWEQSRPWNCPNVSSTFGESQDFQNST